MWVNEDLGLTAKDPAPSTTWGSGRLRDVEDFLGAKQIDLGVHKRLHEDPGVFRTTQETGVKGKREGHDEIDIIVL